MKIKKLRKLSISVLLSVFILSLAFGPVSGEDLSGLTATRFGGTNRYQTSAMVSEYLFDSSEYVVLASGDASGNYADALAGSYLAGFRDAPLLLTYPHTLPSSVESEITRLGATKVYILGGEAAIHSTVVAELLALGIDGGDILRLAGARREETAVEIVDYVRDHSFTRSAEGENFAFIVNGRATADALVAGSYSYKFGIPILLVFNDSLPAVTGIALNEYGFDFLDIVGGTGVVSENLGLLLNDAYTVRQRIAGARRYETSALFGETMFPFAEHFIFVNGADANLADGISAAAFGLPILYVGADTIPAIIINYLNTYMSAFSQLFILGGTQAVSENVSDHLNTIQNELPPMIADAYLVNSAGDYTVYAHIDNINDTITIDIASARANDQFVTGDCLLSKDIYLEVSNTQDGNYNIPSPGRSVTTDENFVSIILGIFPDNPPEGVNAQTLLANSGTQFKLIDSLDATNTRTYTLTVTIESD